MNFLFGHSAQREVSVVIATTTKTPHFPTSLLLSDRGLPISVVSSLYFKTQFCFPRLACHPHQGTARPGERTPGSGTLPLRTFPEPPPGQGCSEEKPESGYRWGRRYREEAEGRPGETGAYPSEAPRPEEEMRAQMAGEMRPSPSVKLENDPFPPFKKAYISWELLRQHGSG